MSSVVTSSVVKTRDAAVKFPPVSYQNVIKDMRQRFFLLHTQQNHITKRDSRWPALLCIIIFQEAEHRWSARLLPRTHLTPIDPALAEMAEWGRVKSTSRPLSLLSLSGHKHLVVNSFSSMAPVGVAQWLTWLVSASPPAVVTTSCFGFGLDCGWRSVMLELGDEL